MERFSRLSRSIKSDITPISQPFSFFDYIDNSFSKLVTLRRLLSQIRHHEGKTLVAEEIEISEDVLYENEDIEKRYSKPKSKLYRLSFFTKNFSTSKGLNSLQNENFIGYIIIKEDDIPGYGNDIRVYESVIRPSKYPNNCIKGQQTWTCQVIDKKFTIDGYIYAQQNAITNVCAHVAIRTIAARYHKDGDMTYREMNNIAGIDHTSKKTGGTDGTGLSNQEIVRIFESIGAKCTVADYTKPNKLTILSSRYPFQKYIYGGIESGFPAIIFFHTLNSKDSYHVIPIFGHTFNEDTWVPNAKRSYFSLGPNTTYIPSESWLSSFIGHDDNWGSNFCIPSDYLYTRLNCDQISTEIELCPIKEECIAYVIYTQPKEIQLNSIQAEAIGVHFLLNGILPKLINLSQIWNKRLLDYARTNKLVIRTVIISKDAYIKHLTNMSDWKNKKILKKNIDVLKKYLQNRYYWLIELSVPELFSSNKRKLGEILIDAQIPLKNKINFKHYVLARIPGYFSLFEQQGTKMTLIPSNIETHVSLF